jgi:hypothetical protein
MPSGRPTSTPSSTSRTSGAQNIPTASVSKEDIDLYLAEEHASWGEDEG